MEIDFYGVLGKMRGINWWSGVLMEVIDPNINKDCAINDKNSEIFTPQSQQTIHCDLFRFYR